MAAQRHCNSRGPPSAGAAQERPVVRAWCSPRSGAGGLGPVYAGVRPGIEDGFVAIVPADPKVLSVPSSHDVEDLAAAASLADLVPLHDDTVTPSCLHGHLRPMPDVAPTIAL